MNRNLASVAFARYVRLYTLHRIESVPDLLLLHVRIETLRYSVAPLRALPLDDTYAADPREGAILVREAVAPRLQALLDARDPFHELNLLGAQNAAWQRYAAERGLPSGPVSVPVVHAPTPARRLPARSGVSRRLAQAQHALETIQTAAETAATLAAAWQNWQIGRERCRLLESQRLLLHDAIRAQMAGQDDALRRALDRDFVQGYLTAHAGDAGYDVLFGGGDADRDVEM